MQKPKKQNLKYKGNYVGNLTGKIQDQRYQDKRTLVFVETPGNHLNTAFRYAPDQCQPEGREETMLRCGACGPFVHHHPLTIYLQDGSRFWQDFFGVW